MKIAFYDNHNKTILLSTLLLSTFGLAFQTLLLKDINKAS